MRYVEISCHAHALCVSGCDLRRRNAALRGRGADRTRHHKCSFWDECTYSSRCRKVQRRRPAGKLESLDLRGMRGMNVLARALMHQIDHVLAAISMRHNRPNVKRR